MSGENRINENPPEPFNEIMNEFFREASGIVLVQGLEGLANIVGGYASYHENIPEEVRSAMATFEGALRERMARESH
jgi:hypothetical protein